MTASQDLKRAPGPMRKGVLAVLVLTVLLATLATFFGTQRYFGQLEAKAASNRMALYLRALNETLRQHQHLPFVLARDPRFSAVLNTDETVNDINNRLNLLASQAKLEAIYVMDANGLVRATSNANETHSFLGQNYGFRPYFQNALQGKRSDYFAIGATSGRPGYFVAEPVSYSGEHRGVIAIKLDVSELQRSWESDSDTVVAINKDGIVVLASNPNWLYRPARELDSKIRDEILNSRQFGTQTLDPLEWTSSEQSRVTVEGTRYLAASGTADWRNWSVHYLQPEAKIFRQTLVATAFFGSIIALLVGFATFLRSRRIELAFTASERQRRELIETNRRLEQAQSELAISAKLAALGHLAASVTHELGQPISAFRNHLAAAEMANEITSPQTAKNLNKLVERMDAITAQFRYFARGRSDPKSHVKLSTILYEVENLLKSELANITYHTASLAIPVVVFGHQVQLEQAFTNLLKNAIHAVEDVSKPMVSVDLVSTDNHIEIRIRDNGLGLNGTSLTDLQEPFFSTKPSGVGMGLGLAITAEIIKDHGGDLTIGKPDQGAEFIVTLPLSSNGDRT